MNGILKDPKPMIMLTGEGSVEITPETEFGRRFIEMRNEAIRGGMKLYRTGDLLKAFEEERAGNDGLGKLWGKS